MSAYSDWLDVTKYFSRPRDVQYGQKYQMFMDPRTGEVQGKKFRVGRNNVWDAFDPSSLNFRGQNFARDYGLAAESLPGNGSYKGFSNRISDLWGKNIGQLINNPQPMPGQEQKTDYSKIFDSVTGLPNRPPQTPQEALMWQWQSDQYAQKMMQSNMKNALSTLQFGIGQVANASPYSLSTMMQPGLQQMSNVYQNFQFQPGDYSAFLRPDVAAQSPGSPLPAPSLGAGAFTGGSSATKRIAPAGAF